MDSSSTTLSHDDTAEAMLGQPQPEVPAPAMVGGARPAETRPVARRQVVTSPRVQGWFDKVEAFVSGLSVRDTFWHRVCSLIWLPLAFFSGIRVRQLDASSFTAVLPFRRFNRNWYRAMAGGALLANSEIAGGMYVFGVCGSDYMVVCRELNYRFLRPCFGPAVYKVTPQQNLSELVRAGGEFNIMLDLDILQQVSKPGERDRRVGKCVVEFHVTPKVHHKTKKQRARRA